ncbi:hypothetical protein [Bacillus sp. FJAT-49736]|uniref:hypothetical protein n=1 Tax=Bacillus sp. FJAT-49736 TaxID=2833582 RepID=UPI001BC939D1|nr:hypothetical protein [Bacillus sp. FJAT-49736]MBS4173713.1 hypothetical protein [Bacillus sp. FJAT-49736]
MVTGIIGMIGLIILLPIMYFLPIGFRVKEKGLMVIIALLVASIGILADRIFQSWQLILSFFLLLLLFSYILAKRIPNRTVTSNSGMKDIALDFATEQKRRKVDVDTKATYPSSLHDLDMETVEDMEEILSPNVLEEEEFFLNQHTDDFQEVEDYLILDDLPLTHEEEQANELGLSEMEKWIMELEDIEQTQGNLVLDEISASSEDKEDWEELLDINTNQDLLLESNESDQVEEDGIIPYIELEEKGSK